MVCYALIDNCSGRAGDKIGFGPTEFEGPLRYLREETEARKDHNWVSCTVSGLCCVH